MEAAFILSKPLPSKKTQIRRKNNKTAILPTT
jgi:hypothetical protein